MQIKKQLFLRFKIVFLTILFSKSGANIDEDQNVHCELKPIDESFARYMDNPSITLNEFYFRFQNYSVDPLRHETAENYKLWKWHRTRTQHGRTLLMLSFHYDVLSMTILTIGVEPSEVLLKDVPHGCFGQMSADSKADLIRNLILNDFYVTKKTNSEIEYESHTERVVFACNYVVTNVNGHAKFVNRCCNLESNGQLVCTDQPDDAWITILYVCITLVKIMVFLFGPLMLPSRLYDSSYMSSRYVVKLEKALKMKLFITESPQTSVRYKTRLTSKDISDWNKFRECLGDLPMDEIIPIQIPELRLKVKGKRIIPENEPPTGLLRTLFDNIVGCKIKSLDPFTECCGGSIYANYETHIRHKCTWHMCLQAFIRVVLLLLIPIPFYLRVILYYKFEEEEIFQRRKFTKSLGLEEHFDFYRTNVIHFLSPSHDIFLTAYILYFLGFFIFAIAGKKISEKLKSIVRCSLQDMSTIERTRVLQILLRIWLWPFKNCGLLALLFAPIYAFVMTPACSFIFAIYCLPTIYLTYRLCYHARHKCDYKNQNTDDGSPLISKKKFHKAIKKLSKNLTEIDRNVHRVMSISEQEEYVSPCARGSGMFHSVRQTVIQIMTGAFCVACLYSMILLAVEATGILVEIMAFTMMGVIVNAWSTLRYVSMALLVLVYLHDCYSNVYKNYLTFNKAVIEDIMDRVEDLKKVASLPSNMQENFGFTVRPVEAVDQIPTTFVFDKTEPRWKIGHLLLFLDSHDTPRIPIRLFRQLCEVRVHGAPGPVYVNLLRATGKFFIIVVFLFFVMIVVMAFGNVHQVSSTNQTLATLAGGFVPMLLKNIMPRSSANLNLKTLSFKGHIDEVICEFKQNWPIDDIIVEKDEPNDEEENDTFDNLTDNGDENAERSGLKRKPTWEQPFDGEHDEKKKEKSKESVLEKYMKENSERKQKDKDGKDNNDIGNGDAQQNSVQDDNIVDLFVDFSVAVPWSIYGSTESVASIDLLPNSGHGDAGGSSYIDEIPQIKVEYSA